MDVNATNFFQLHDLGGFLTFAVFCIILFIVVGISGNVLTIAALIRCPRIRSTTSAFIISLCLADACFCTVNLPFTASRFIHQRWIHGEGFCVVFPFIRYSNVAVSLFSIMAISVNRFILIAYPGIHKTVYQIRNIRLMIAFCWIFSFAMLMPTLLQKWGKFGYDKEIDNCSIVAVNGKSSKKFLFVFAFVLPSIVIILSYTGIFWKVKKSNERMRKHNNSKEKDQKRRREEWRITFMVLVIFISFVTCYLPITVMKVTGVDKKNPYLYVIGYLLIYMSACINPIIYVIMNKQYRQAYKTIICCRRPRLKSITSSQGNNVKIGKSSCSSTTKMTTMHTSTVNPSNDSSVVLDTKT